MRPEQMAGWFVVERFDAVVEMRKRLPAVAEQLDDLSRRRLEDLGT